MRSLLIGFLLIPLFLRAQVSMEDFISSSSTSPTIQAFDSQDDYLKSNPYKLSPIRSMEFRTESNQLDSERQDYALRLKPTSPWEVKRNKEYFKTYQEVLSLDRERELKEALKIRYETIINWAYLEKQKKHKREEYNLTQTLVEILEAQRLSEFFDGNDYAELKIEQLEKVVELEELSFEEDEQRLKIEALHPPAQNQKILWSFEKLISIEQIQLFMEYQTNTMEAGEVAYRQKRVELAQSEWALEKSSINIGFLQAQYQQYRIDQDRRPWSIGLGVTLPIFNPNKDNMAKRKLEMIRAEGDLTEAKQEQQASIALMKHKIQKLAERYSNLQDQLDNLNVDELAANLQTIEGSNPIAVVRLKSSLIKSRYISARLQKNIYMAYLDYLWHAELLQQQPVSNLFSNKLN